MKDMLKALCLALCIMFFAASAQASDFSKISTNDKIVSALSKLESIDADSVISVLNGNNSTQKPIRVMFRDLAVYGQTDCEAVTLKTKADAYIIFISNKHQNSSPESIACLIAHESVHEAGTNTVKEEVQAWTVEANTWAKFTAQNPELKIQGTKLAKRLNYLASIYAKNGSESLGKLIASTETYKGLQ